MYRKCAAKNFFVSFVTQKPTILLMSSYVVEFHRFLKCLCNIDLLIIKREYSLQFFSK